MVRERWIGWRNRLLSSPRFQRLASAFPLTRPVARRHAARAFDLVAGFAYSQTLLACVELGLFDRLADAPASVTTLAEAGDMPLASMTRLVRAAAALGLLELLPGDRVTLGVAGAALAANPGALAMIAHHPRFYADLADPVALLRRGGGGGALASFWPYGPAASAGSVSCYSELMAKSQPAVAAELLDAYDVSRHRRLLDVGGGEGAFLAAVALRAPAVELGLFDLPAVVARARSRLAARVVCHGGDFLADPLPSGHDLVTLVRVLHDHDDPAALRLLRGIRAALPPGGRLLIGEPMADAPAAERVGAAYFGLYLLAMGSGRARSPAEIGELLRQAGFSRWRLLATRIPLTAGAIIADV